MGARERPLTENEGLSEWPLMGNTGVFGAKNNKETFRSAQVGKAEQRIVHFSKGDLLERPRLKK